MRKCTAGFSLWLLVFAGCYSGPAVRETSVAEAVRGDSTAELYSGIRTSFDKDANRTRVWFDDRRVETRPGPSRKVVAAFHFFAEFPGEEPVSDVRYGLALTVDAWKAFLTRADSLVLMLGSTRLLLEASDYQVLLRQERHTKEGLTFSMTRSDLIRIAAAREITGQIGGSMRFTFGKAQRQAIDELLSAVPERVRPEPSARRKEPPSAPLAAPAASPSAELQAVDP